MEEQRSLGRERGRVAAKLLHPARAGERRVSQAGGRTPRIKEKHCQGLSAAKIRHRPLSKRFLALLTAERERTLSKFAYGKLAASATE